MARRRHAVLLVGLCCLALVVAACSDDGSDAGPTTVPSGGQSGDDGTSAPSAADVRVITLDGSPTDGPAEYDQVTVVQQGAADAENVLVLAPGTSAGAAYFLPLGADIVRELEGWQVWSIDRRENLLEDHSLIDERKAGDATSQEAFDYYLEWIADDTITDHFDPPADDDVSFASDWGMDVAVGDVDVVVQEASELGGAVVLGGHSLGGTITVAYATWDFDGAPGAENLSGLVLVDGGSAGGEPTSAAEAEAELAEIRSGTPFNDLLGLGLPWAPGVFNVLGATAALQEPDEPNIAYDFALLPDDLKPPVSPTNAAQYGYALDVDTSPESLALVHLSLGGIADTGEPRGWNDDGLVPLERAAAMFSGIESIDGTAWYHPLRLSLDGGAVNGGITNPAQEPLGVRAIHGTELALPIYAFETSFGEGRVLAGARLLAEQSDIPDDDLTLVEGHGLTHTDPMGVEPDNPLVQTLVPFLHDLG